MSPISFTFKFLIKNEYVKTPVSPFPFLYRLTFSSWISCSVSGSIWTPYHFVPDLQAILSFLPAFLIFQQSSYSSDCSILT